MLSKPNNKTEIYSFNLPARSTCPGKTKLCSDNCYAFRYENQYPNARKLYLRNKQLSLKDSFVSLMVKTIPKDIKKFRIHVSGDFYSTEYIQKWIKIVRARTDIQFYAYTRSWRDPKLRKYLTVLGRLKNFTLNLSYDVESGIPTNKNFRWAFMSVNDEEPTKIRPTDIVFRVKRKTIIHKIKNCRVCPLERGIKLNNFSCNKCDICINKQ